jgi:hypothetical protein
LEVDVLEAHPWRLSVLAVALAKASQTTNLDDIQSLVSANTFEALFSTSKSNPQSPYKQEIISKLLS